MNGFTIFQECHVMGSENQKNLLNLVPPQRMAYGLAIITSALNENYPAFANVKAVFR
ncbi:MAG: hypothetical protein WAW61_03195 [Methylococcaceae bacterium]